MASDITSPDQEDLLTPDFLRKIERMNLLTRRIFPGRLRGERRSIKRGASVEFADYRNYTVGDDFRRVDWNVYARLEKLFLKLFVEEEDLHVYVLLDVSRSMDFGTPTKLLYGKRIAAALSYIALANLDRVGLATLSGSKASPLSLKRGKQAAFEIFEHLKSVRSDGETNLAASLREFSLKTSQSGPAIVISDFFDQGYRDGVMSLLSRKFEVTLIHVLDKEEVSPALAGDLVLIDSETGSHREITVTQSLLRRYRERLASFCNEIESFSVKYGCNYVRVTNESEFEDLVLSYLRKKRLIA